MKDLFDMFDDSGNFKEDYFDPYRTSSEDVNFPAYDMIFEMGYDSYDGFGSVKQEVHKAIENKLKEKNYTYNCTLMCIYHSEIHGNGTKDSYPAIYYWR
jgi:hypothetical protein